jgi:hypothetical protein
MSAWRVSEEHISALVYWMIKAGLTDEDRADEIGAMLWWENYKSVNARYSESDEIPGYKYRVPTPIPAGPDGYPNAYDPEDMNHALKLVACYDYQSCEHDGWEASIAYRRSHALRAYLENQGADRDINDGPWGI